MLYGSGLENNPSIILVPGESHVFPNLLLPSTIAKHVYNLDNFWNEKQPCSLKVISNCYIMFGGPRLQAQRHPRTILRDIHISCPATQPDEHNPITILLGGPSPQKWMNKKTRKSVPTFRATGMIEQIWPTIPANRDDNFFYHPSVFGDRDEQSQPLGKGLIIMHTHA